MKEILYQLAVDTSTKLEVNGGTSSSVQNVYKVNADTVLSSLLNSVYYMLGIAAIISIIVGGIMYATSAGDSTAITKAKNIILYAIIGLVVAIMAFTITGFVIGRVG